MLRVLIFLVSLGARAIRAMCRCRADLVIENLALRQQVTALKKERPRPPLEDTDRAFWVALRSSWPAWASRLVIVNADTVARWNRDRFCRYWARISRPRYPGRPRIDAEIRRLVRTMAQDGWGAPRIHAELTKLGFVVSEMTVSRYMPRRRAEPDEVKRWIAFLRNHKDDIAAMDLFAVPTASLRLLYGFFVIEHGRRREMLEHVVVLSERHLVRLMRLYISYYHEGPLPLGSRQRHPELKTRHAPTITDRKSRRVAASGWAPPPLRMARRRLSQFSRCASIAGVPRDCVVQLRGPLIA